MVITKCLDVYSSEFYIGMFGFNPDMDEEESYNRGKAFLERYAMNDADYKNECLTVMRQIFKQSPSEMFRIHHHSAYDMFQDRFHLFVNIGGTLFGEDDYTLIQAIGKSFGDKYWYIVEDETCEQDVDVAFKLRFPIDISWQELISGGCISDVVFNMFHNNYYVFGDSGCWGRWSDCENSWCDYELFGYIKDNEFVQKYKAWGAKSAKQWADYCNSEDFPQALSRLLNTIVEKE